MYADGARVFVEIGPRGVLTGLVGEILGDRPHLAVALNPSRKRDSDRQLREAMVRLRVAGLALDLGDPYARPREPASEKKGGAVVRLNGSNYVTEQTRQAYQQALRSGHRVGGAADPSGTGQSAAAEPAPWPTTPEPARWPMAPAGAPVDGPRDRRAERRPSTRSASRAPPQPRPLRPRSARSSAAWPSSRACRARRCAPTSST